MRTTAIAALVALAALAACSKPEPVVTDVGQGAISVEPTYTGKYK